MASMCAVAAHPYPIMPTLYFFMEVKGEGIERG